MLEWPNKLASFGHNLVGNGMGPKGRGKMRRVMRSDRLTGHRGVCRELPNGPAGRWPTPFVHQSPIVCPVGIRPVGALMSHRKEENEERGFFLLPAMHGLALP